MRLFTWLRDKGLTVALRVHGRWTAGRKKQALLLADPARPKPVALVWALGIEEDTRDRKLDGMSATLEAFSTVIVVCDTTGFAPVLRKGYLVEAVPAPEEQAIHMSDGAWRLYLERRFGRMRKNWAPDFEFFAGEGPDRFLDRVGAQTAKNRTVPDPSDDLDTFLEEAP